MKWPLQLIEWGMLAFGILVILLGLQLARIEILKHHRAELLTQAQYLVADIAVLQDSIVRLNSALRYQVRYTYGLDGEPIVVLFGVEQ